MSLISWKRSGWVVVALAVFLIVAVITSICSSGFRSGFKILAPNFSFPGGGPYLEIGLFNFLLICSAIFGILSVALRYSYIMDQLQVMPISIEYINKVSITMGIISFLALFVIASVSASLLENVIAVQSLGTYIFIGVGVIFTVLQTVVTYSSTRYSFIFTIRLLLALILFSTFLTSMVFTEKSKGNSLLSNRPNSTDITVALFASKNWTEPNFWTVYEKDLLIACILDWISVIIYAFFFLSFFQEFQTITAYLIMRPFIGSSSDFRSSSMTVNERV